MTTKSRSNLDQLTIVEFQQNQFMQMFEQLCTKVYNLLIHEKIAIDIKIRFQEMNVNVEQNCGLGFIFQSILTNLQPT